MLDRVAKVSTTLERVVYAGPKRHDVTAALARGFGARLVDSRTGNRVPGALHFVAGLQHGSLSILRDIRAAGEDYVFVDRAYFEGGPGSQWFRVVPHAYQHHWVKDAPDDRAKALNLTRHLAPKRASGRHILLVPPSQAICALFGLGDWEAGMLARLAHCTDRPVDVSRKGDPRPLADRFKNCHVVVTWTSNVAVEAACAGVPVFVADESAAHPVGDWLGHMEARIESPSFEEAREPWLRGLAYGQWTLTEIAAGKTRAFMDQGAC